MRNIILTAGALIALTACNNTPDYDASGFFEATEVTLSVDVIDLQIDRLNDRINRCKVIAPISGTVITKFCEAGEFAAPGKPIVKIADLKKMKLTAYFTSEQLADLKVGQEVTVLANYGGDAVKEYPGRIISIASESEFTPKNIQTQDSRSNLVYAVKIAVDNSDGTLKIGSFGNVRL